jgi:hypothetical protein
MLENLINQKFLSRITGAFVVKVTSQVASDINRSNRRSAGNRMRVTCFRQNEHLKHSLNDNEHTVGFLAGHGTVCLSAVDEFRCFRIGQFLSVPWNPEEWLRSQFSGQL